MSLLIKNGRIITVGEDQVADIFIEGETISAIGKNLQVKADKVIDASGRLVFPGGIDRRLKVAHLALVSSAFRAWMSFLAAEAGAVNDSAGCSEKLRVLEEGKPRVNAVALI